MKKDDIVTAAILRAKTKLAVSKDEKIAAYIQSLYKRFASAYEKLNDAKAENNDKVDMLQQHVYKLKHEIDSNRQILKKLKADMTLTTSRENLDNVAVNSGDSGISNKH